VTGKSSGLSHQPTPVIGLPCCTRLAGEISPHVTHAIAEKYAIAITDGMGGLPMLIPALGDRIDPEEAVARLDGLLVTGSRSNVEPHHYGAEKEPELVHDPKRDGLTLPLIRAAVAADLPVLAICRGIQELNVALGGTLHQRVQEVEGRLDHRAPKGTLDERYAHCAHPVALAAGGLFERLADGARELVVNSLHQQGIDRMAPGLEMEAVAPDGLVEAVRLSKAAFIVGVQWHPEHRLAENPFSRALFEAFGQACRARAQRRRLAAA
jgi:putative glutamine amidotransferase